MRQPGAKHTNRCQAHKQASSTQTGVKHTNRCQAHKQASSTQHAKAPRLCRPGSNSVSSWKRQHCREGNVGRQTGLSTRGLRKQQRGLAAHGFPRSHVAACRQQATKIIMPGEMSMHGFFLILPPLLPDNALTQTQLKPSAASSCCQCDSVIARGQTSPLAGHTITNITQPACAPAGTSGTRARPSPCVARSCAGGRCGTWHNIPPRTRPVQQRRRQSVGAQSVHDSAHRAGATGACTGKGLGGSVAGLLSCCTPAPGSLARGSGDAALPPTCAAAAWARWPPPRHQWRCRYGWPRRRWRRQWWRERRCRCRPSCSGCGQSDGRTARQG